VARRDVVAGLVLGFESVPDGLAAGVLAGVNPLAGLYGYLFGMAGAAVCTSSSFMAVQATGAMSLVVADAGLDHLPNPDGALFTRAILTGVVMLAAGVACLGKLVAFNPTAVMTGFITAVGVSIVLGQLSNLTGYQAQGANRIVRVIDQLAHVGLWHPATFAVGVTTIVIVVLDRTPVGPLGLVVAVVVASAAAVILHMRTGSTIVLLRDLVVVPRGLPVPVLPDLADIGQLVVPAFSLAFVGLVQGAGVGGDPDARLRARRRFTRLCRPGGRQLA
jgi:SulP family sulfate permease